MMRLWANSYSKSTPVVTSATLSVVAHTVVIAACVVATMPSATMAPDSFANRTYYVPPPDRVPGQRGSREAVHYIDLLKEGPGIGDGPRTIGDTRPTAAVDETVGRASADSVTSPPVAPIPGPPDSVFSVLEVDTAVVRSANSAAPAYPLKLLEAHVMGSVSAQYVVDTTGFADTSSFQVMKATNPEFITAVREALPYMRFTPAKIGSLKVRQLVEQQFSFKITNDTVVAPRKRKP
jgi:periplasmic protein TonB